MHSRSVFKKLLGWKDIGIKDVSFDDEGVVLEVRLRNPRPVCSGCQVGVGGVYDRRPPRSWRHLDLGGMALRLRYALRRVACPRCGIVVEQVPFADKRSWHTRDFEDATAYLAQRCDKTTVSELMRIAWRTVGSIIERVTARWAKGDVLDGITRIGVDELSYRKHHEYITIVYDHDRGRVLWAHPGKSAETLLQFFKQLGEQRCARILSVTLDMSAAYIKAVQEAVPQAMLIFDRFHVQRLAHDAVDDLRREEVRRAGGARVAGDLKRTRWVLQKNPWNLTLAEKQKLATLERTNRRLYRGYLLKEALAGIMDGRQWLVAERRLDEWLAWAKRSRLSPFVRLAATIHKHRDGILNYVRTRLTNAPVEGLNGKIRTITRRSFGFHRAASLIAMVFLCCTDIELTPVFKYP